MFFFRNRKIENFSKIKSSKISIFFKIKKIKNDDFLFFLKNRFDIFWDIFLFLSSPKIFFGDFFFANKNQMLIPEP